MTLSRLQISNIVFLVFAHKKEACMLKMEDKYNTQTHFRYVECLCFLSSLHQP